jgi:2-amino-4-hydroxy-6-hydroxymethyldihydropteridine diphosphokinase
MNQPRPEPIEYGLALGSNIGDRLKYLTAARDILSGTPGLTLLDSAPVYETEPVGVQPEHKDKYYLNTILIVLSELLPEEIFEITQNVESDEGRVRSSDRNAPRPLDIDIIYAGQLSLSRDQLTIPHPRWASRRFVVKPLADVRPGLLLPGEPKTVQEILEKLPPEPDVVLYREKW